jgi:hypothetical protein
VHIINPLMFVLTSVQVVQTLVQYSILALDGRVHCHWHSGKKTSLSLTDCTLTAIDSPRRALDNIDLLSCNRRGLFVVELYTTAPAYSIKARRVETHNWRHTLDILK